jgi:hypothetical protein
MGRCRVMGGVPADSYRVPIRNPAHFFRPRQRSGSHCRAAHCKPQSTFNHSHALHTLSSSPTPTLPPTIQKDPGGFGPGGLGTLPNGPRTSPERFASAEARLLAAKYARKTQVPSTRLASPWRPLPGPSGLAKTADIPVRAAHRGARPTIDRDWMSVASGTCCRASMRPRALGITRNH